MTRTLSRKTKRVFTISRFVQKLSGVLTLWSFSPFLGMTDILKVPARQKMPISLNMNPCNGSRGVISTRSTENRSGMWGFELWNFLKCERFLIVCGSSRRNPMYYETIFICRTNLCAAFLSMVAGTIHYSKLSKRSQDNLSTSRSTTPRCCFFGHEILESDQNARKFKRLPTPKTRAQDEVKIRWKPASKPFSWKEWKPAIVWNVFPIVWSDLLCCFECFHARINAHIFQPSLRCRWKIVLLHCDERGRHQSITKDSLDVLLSNSHPTELRHSNTTNETPLLCRIRQREPLDTRGTCFGFGGGGQGCFILLRILLSR